MDQSNDNPEFFIFDYEPDDADNQFFTVEEKLPDQGVNVLWWYAPRATWELGSFWPEEGRYAPGYFKGGQRCGYIFDGNVTHWMYLPTPPTGLAVRTIARALRLKYAK